MDIGVNNRNLENNAGKTKSLLIKMLTIQQFSIVYINWNRIPRDKIAL